MDPVRCLTHGNAFILLKYFVQMVLTEIAQNKQKKNGLSPGTMLLCQTVRNPKIPWYENAFMNTCVDG